VSLTDQTAARFASANVGIDAESEDGNHFEKKKRGEETQSLGDERQTAPSARISKGNYFLPPASA